MKKLMAWALAAVLVLSLTTAYAWSCPGCGAEMSGKFCAECGTKKPANVCPGCGKDYGEQMPKFCSECGTKMSGTTPTAAPTATPAVEAEYLTWVDFDENADGSVSLSWKGGVAPYKVRYLQKYSDDYETDLNKEDSFGQWLAEKDYTETSYTYNRLKPGTAYWLNVVGQDGNGRFYKYEPDAPATLQGYATTLEVVPYSKMGEETTKLDYIPADKAGFEDSDIFYGAYVVLHYSNTGAEKAGRYQLAITAPNGSVRVDHYGDFTFNSGSGKKVGWNFYNMEDYFQRLRNTFGTVQPGDYLVEFFVDGKLAGSAVLPVAEEDGFRISSVIDQGDGTCMVNWTDNGKGPFTLRYVDKWSDDFEADKDNPLTSAYWTDESDFDGTSVRLRHLIPGCNYWITVEDSEGNVCSTTYQAPRGGNFAADMTATVKPRRKVAEDTYTDLEEFSAQALNAAVLADSAGEYGIYLDLEYQLSQDTDMATQIVITMPNGVRFVEYASDFTYYDGGTYWECYNLGWYFGKCHQWYGEVPQGTYFGEIYIEGDYAVSFSFEVGE